jgi:hypothetical protein
MITWRAFKWVIGASLVSALSVAASAQWSIGAPGSRQPPPGTNRYVMLVLANPVPGLENQFNDWYNMTHLGDLLQLPGWVGAQRFRIVSNLNPRPTKEGYRHGYLAIWDQEGASSAPIQKLAGDAIAGGKSRRGAGYDYIGGLNGGGTFQVIGPRMTRPDGKGPFMPDVSDNTTPRPNRYIVMDYASPAAGHEKEIDAAIDQRIRSVLTLPGWMAAQRFHQVPPAAGRPGPAKPEYLTIWELEGHDVNALQAAFDDAIKGGRVKPLPIDPATWEFTYWEPMTPYITKEDFVR